MLGRGPTQGEQDGKGRVEQTIGREGESKACEQ